MQLKPVGSNMTEVKHGKYTILYSYETPVAAKTEDGEFFQTDKKFSATTTRHISKWLGKNLQNSMKKPQSFFDGLIKKSQQKMNESVIGFVNSAIDNLFGSGYLNESNILDTHEEEISDDTETKQDGSKKYWWSSGSGDLEFEMTLDQAQSVSQPGKDAEEDVRMLMQDSKMKEVVEYLMNNMERVKKELRETGAWDEDELEDTDMNIVRLLWLAGNDISERVFMGDTEETEDDETVPNDSPKEIKEDTNTGNIHVLLDGSRGIYIPRDFVTGFDMDAWNVSEEDAQDCSDPENEYYWETWDSILNSASYTSKDGRVWSLYQDSDLFAVAYDNLTDEEKESFGMNESSNEETNIDKADTDEKM